MLFFFLSFSFALQGHRTKLLGDKLYLFDERKQATVFVPELQLGKKGAFVCIHQHACTLNRSKTRVALSNICAPKNRLI